MEFELVELPQAPEFVPRSLRLDPPVAQRDRRVPPANADGWYDQALFIPDQEYGS